MRSLFQLMLLLPVPLLLFFPSHAWGWLLTAPCIAVVVAAVVAAVAAVAVASVVVAVVVAVVVLLVVAHLLAFFIMLPLLRVLW